MTWGRAICGVAKSIPHGDIFDLSGEMIGSVDAVYDRAALVALPPQIRDRYARHVIKITDNAPQLLICYTYDQILMDGPPFSVSGSEVNQLYSAGYEKIHIAELSVTGGLNGVSAVNEIVWLLRPSTGFDDLGGNFVADDG